MARRLVPALLALLALVLSACGSSASGTDGENPAAAVPQTAVFFASAQIRPEGDAKSGLAAAGRKILAGKELGPQLDRVFSRAGASADVDYLKDVKPWLGRRLSVFLAGIRPDGVDGALIVQTTDPGKARDALEKSERKSGRTRRSYRGETYTVPPGSSRDADGVVGGYLVAGSETGVRAIIDTIKGGGKLSDSSSYQDAIGKVNADALALFYLDTPRLLDSLGQLGPRAAVALGQLRSLPRFQNAKPVAADLSADSNGIRVEAPTSAPSSGAEDAIAALPGDSWIAFASPKAGDSLRNQFKLLAAQQGGASIAQLNQILTERTGLDLNRDVLSWIGGARAFVGGTTPLGLEGALVIDSKDPAASQRFVKKIIPLVRRSAKVAFRTVPGGFELRPSPSAGPVSILARGDKVFVAYGQGTIDRVLKPSSRLDGTPTYRLAQQALGGGRPSFLVSIPAIVQLIQNTGKGNSEQFRRALPYLQAFGAIAAGRKEQGGQKLGVVAVGLK